MYAEYARRLSARAELVTSVLFDLRQTVSEQLQKHCRVKKDMFTEADVLVFFLCAKRLQCTQATCDSHFLQSIYFEFEGCALTLRDVAAIVRRVPIVVGVCETLLRLMLGGGMLSSGIEASSLGV